MGAVLLGSRVLSSGCVSKRAIAAGYRQSATSARASARGGSETSASDSRRESEVMRAVLIAAALAALAVGCEPTCKGEEAHICAQLPAECRRKRALLSREEQRQEEKVFSCNALRDTCLQECVRDQRRAE